MTCSNGTSRANSTRNGRSLLRRRRRSCLLIAIAILAVGYMFLPGTEHATIYVPLRPLASARDEARRLLAFITHQHVKCDGLVADNQTRWPVCYINGTETHTKLVYSIGPSGDDGYSMERSLAVNHSSQVYIITHRTVPSTLALDNRTHLIRTAIVPNDPADFARNSFGQRTLNDVQRLLKGHVDTLMFHSLRDSDDMWQVLHFLSEDQLLDSVNRLHITMAIVKLDEDFLYNWYRTLYQLFYKDRLRLFHTRSADSLCLQVTMMESCVYYLSFIRDPGSHHFVLYPPAEYGEVEMEQSRLLAHLSNTQVSCDKMTIPPSDVATSLHQSWTVCGDDAQNFLLKDCTVVRLCSAADDSMQHYLVGKGCTVHTFQLVKTRPTLLYRQYFVDTQTGETDVDQLQTTHQMFDFLSTLPRIGLIQIDMKDRWEDAIITSLLDSGILRNVTQLVVRMRLSASETSISVRSRYSELLRFASQGMHVFHCSLPENNSPAWTRYGHSGVDFQLGLVKQDS